METEEDSLQAHTHDVSDSGHDHGYDDKYANGYSKLFDCGTNCGANFEASHARTTNSATSNIKVTDVNGARTSDETRPKNIRVVYIMKVF